MDVFPFLNFYSQDNPYRFRHADEYSLKTRTILDIRLSPCLAVFTSGMKKVLSEDVFIIDFIFFISF